MPSKTDHNTVRNLRIRYIIGLSAIALLITASFFTMQHVISAQRNFSVLVNLAGHQAGLANRIAFFGSLMASTNDEAEFNMARSQVGRTIHKMRDGYKVLREGDPENGIPHITNENLETIYTDPMVGLDEAISNFLGKANNLYNSEREDLNTGSAAYLYVTTYGPHVLEPLLDAVVDEFQVIAKRAINKIQRFETVIWVTALLTLLIEMLFIFHPLEGHISRALSTLQRSVEELTKMRHRLISAQQLAKVGDWELDVESSTITWSDQVFDICGTDPENFTVSRPGVLKLIHQDDRKKFSSSLLSVSRDNSPVTFECRIIRPDNEERIVFQHVTCTKSDTGRVLKLSGTIQDVTERRELISRLEKLSDHIPGFIFQFHTAAGEIPLVSYASTGVKEIYGTENTAIQANPQIILDRIHPEDKARFQAGLWDFNRQISPWHDQYRINHPEKGTLWVEGHATPEQLPSGGTLWHGYIWDITDRKKSESQIQKLALYDPLTGVANRRLLKEKLLHAIATSRRNQRHGAVLMLDLDNFKSLNDTKGHDVGDQLLIEVTRRIQSCLRETDTVARLGGDEFVVVLEWLAAEKEISQKQAMDIAEKIRFSLGQPYILGEDNHVHNSSASIGVVVFIDREKDVSELLKMADLAMYEAKDLGRNKCCLFSKSRQTLVIERDAMANNLKAALKNNEFSLYLQPQITSAAQLGGAEALLRWFPADKPAISPAQFIPLAEQTGLIIPLGEWVLRQACEYIRSLESYPLQDDFAIAINISARQFSDDNFSSNVQRIITETGVDTRRLKFELTESCLLQNLERGRNMLEQLNEMGIEVELDDFGTGYSSFNSLKKLPFSTVKLDKSLIHDIKDQQGKAIVRAAVAMAKAMSIKIIAEGVETQDQRNFLIAEGCDLMQGFLFARPMPMADFREYVNIHNLQKSPHFAEKMLL